MGICQPKPKRDTDEIEGVTQPIRRTPGTDVPKTSTAEEANPFQPAPEELKEMINAEEQDLAGEADKSEVAAEENPEDVPITTRKSIPMKQASNEPTFIEVKQEKIPIEEKKEEAPPPPEAEEKAAENQPEEKKPLTLEELIVEHTRYFDEFQREWDTLLTQVKNKKPRENEHFKELKKSLLSDKDLIPNDHFISPEKDWIHKGFIRNGKIHGPGSRLMKSKEIQFEGIWIDGKMVGQGYMITFDNDKNITEVMRCVHGVPQEKVHQRKESEVKIGPNNETNQARGAGTGGHEFESKEKPQSEQA